MRDSDHEASFWTEDSEAVTPATPLDNHESETEFYDWTTEDWNNLEADDEDIYDRYLSEGFVPEV